jgi:1-acyl-sn-glycerol-3-phosphate acyltransferase
MYGLLPLALRTVLGIESIRASKEGVERLRHLGRERAVLMPNHPTDKDSIIMFHLSKTLGERWNYLAARELFDFAPVAWILQRCGVYSVMRGTNDRKSFRATVDLLVEGVRKVVIFPEGLTCWQNDTVMPFQEGVALFGFWALEKLSKLGCLPPLYLVPVAIKYVYVRSMKREIERSITRLERRLRLSSEDSSLYGRLRKVGEAVLTSAEKEYGVRSDRHTDFDLRLQNMKELLVNRIAVALGVDFGSDQALPTRIRVLVNKLNEIVLEEPAGSDYQVALHRRRQAEVEHLYDDLSRVLHFIATYVGYVSETMSAERFMEVIGQLEREVFGKRRDRGPSRVYVEIGEPIDLAQYFDAYQSDRRQMLGKVTCQLEERVKRMIDDLGRFASPLKPPFQK